MEAEQEFNNVPLPQGGFSEHSTESSIRFQLTFNDIIEEIEKVLRCEIPIMDRRTGEVSYVVDPESTPLINKQGMARIRTILKSKLSRNIPLSDLEDEEVRKIAKNVEMNIIDTIEDNWDAFEIPDTSAATTIKQTIGTQVFALLKRSKHGATLRHLRSTHHTSEIQQTSQRQQTPQDGTQKASMIPRIFGGRRW